MQNSRGFTIIELLLVVVIVGILVALTVVSYASISSKASQSSIQSDLINAAKQIQIYSESSNTGYPTSLSLLNGGAGLKASNGGLYTYQFNNSVSPRTYCVSETIGSTTYHILNNSSSVSLGGCIVQDGLVVNLDGADQTSYPGSGSKWYDLSGTGNTANLMNGPVYMKDYGGYFHYDGVDDYIAIPNSSSTSFTDRFSQMVVFRLNTSFGSSFKTLFGKSTYTVYGMIIEWYAGNPILFDFTSSPDGARNTVSLVYPNYSGWVIAFHTYDSSYSGNSHLGYVYDKNGLQTTGGAVQKTISTSTAQLVIGGSMDFDVSYAAVYNRALSAAEVTQNFNALKTRYGL